MHLPVYQRQVLNRRTLGDKRALFDDLFGGSDNDDEKAVDGNARVAGAAVGGVTTATTGTTTAATATGTTSTSTTSAVVVSTSSSVSTTLSSTTSSTISTSSSSVAPTTTSTSSTSSTPVAPSTSTVPGSQVIVTAQITSAAPSASSTITPQAVGASGGAPKDFWQNKAAVGVVFGIVGLLGLGLLIFIISLLVRRVRRKRLVEDAVSFNPSDLLDHHTGNDIQRFNSRSSIEKAPYQGSDNGHSAYNHGNVPTTYAATYDYNQPSYDYNNQGYGYDQAGYGQGYYASQQPQDRAYGGYNNNPVQLPSQNLGPARSIPHATPPPALHPTMNLPPGEEAALRSGGSGYLNGQLPPGLPQQVQRAPSAGTISDNPYLSGGKEYKIANV